MKSAKKKAGYGAKDLREVSDNPELTKVDFAKARPFREVFPDLAASIRRGRGPSKSPTKKQLTLRISPEVIEYFKSTGDGWQARIDETLREVVKGKRPAIEGTIDRGPKLGGNGQFEPLNRARDGHRVVLAAEADQLDAPVVRHHFLEAEMRQRS